MSSEVSTAVRAFQEDYLQHLGGPLDAHPSRKIGLHEVDLGRAVLHQDGAEIPLTTQEAQLLAYLAARPGQAVSRQALLQAVWGFQTGHVRTRAVDNTVYRLRAKLEQRPAAPRHLITVRGLGYRLEV